jgi:hypothetical protein
MMDENKEKKDMKGDQMTKEKKRRRLGRRDV